MTSRNWKDLEDLTVIMKPFDVATTLMSSETKVTILMMRPVTHKIMNNFLTPQTHDSKLIGGFKKTLMYTLKRRFIEKTHPKKDEKIHCSLPAQFLGKLFHTIKIKKCHLYSIFL